MDLQNINPNFSPEYMELCAYFSQPQFDSEIKFIAKVMAERPDLRDKRLISGAASWMFDSASEGVELSVSDALRLAGRYKAKPISELVQSLNEAGIFTLEDLGAVLKKADDIDPAPPRVPSLPAAEKAAKLKGYATALAKNKDIILLGLPVFWPELDVTWAKLAILCDELTKDEQDVLTAMRVVADDAELQTHGGIPVAVFEIQNIHDK